MPYLLNALSLDAETGSTRMAVTKPSLEQQCPRSQQSQRVRKGATAQDDNISLDAETGSPRMAVTKPSLEQQCPRSRQSKRVREGVQLLKMTTSVLTPKPDPRAWP